MSATIAELTAELVAKVTEVAELQNRGFSVFDLEDFDMAVGSAGPPLVGVMYLGGRPTGNEAEDSTGRKRTTAAMMFQPHFSVVIAVAYGSALGDQDTKVSATDLMDGIRGKLLGYSGVNSRPWRLAEEGPQSSSIEDVIFYGQVWYTNTNVNSNP